MQPNALHSGQARGSIVKLKLKEQQSKPRFLIRTKAAVMGVRGTEFVIAVDSTGMTTQVHTLEGMVDVAANETALMSGSGVSVPSGHFIEATGSGGVSPVQIFDQAGFEQSLKPAIPGGPAQIAFSGPGGGTVMKLAPALPSLAEAPLRAMDEPIDTRREPEEPKAEQRGSEAQSMQQQQPPEKKSSGPGRSIKLISFQAAAFYQPPVKYAERPEDTRINGTGESIKALAVSWNPEIPVPVIPFLSVRGHLGVVFGKDGDLESGLLMREFQVFASANLLGTFFAEAGWGRVVWTRRDFSSNVVSVNVGIKGFATGAFSRIFVGHTQTLTESEEESVRAGFGLEF